MVQIICHISIVITIYFLCSHIPVGNAFLLTSKRNGCYKDYFQK